MECCTWPGRLGESWNVAHGRGGSPCLWGDCFTPGCSHMYMCGLMLVLFCLVQAMKACRGHLPPFTSIVTPCCTGVPCFTVWGRLACFISVPSVICLGGTGSNVCMWCFPPFFSMHPQTYCCCLVVLYMYVLLKAHVWWEASFGSGVGSHSFCLWSGCV